MDVAEAVVAEPQNQKNAGLGDEDNQDTVEE
jgi:hypothetical protein